MAVSYVGGYWLMVLGIVRGPGGNPRPIPPPKPLANFKAVAPSSPSSSQKAVKTAWAQFILDSVMLVKAIPARVILFLPWCI